MDFDFQWLLIGLPVAFALGWVASRLDQRQWKRDAPRPYVRGLTLLLNEQPDKAVDAFIESMRDDPGSAELQLALGSLFRRRGEFERAVRVHEHLLTRADLKPGDRSGVQRALAQDFMSAGLFDRAEQAWRALEGGTHDVEARLALLSLAERSRDWPRAAEIAGQLERAGRGSFAARIAHYGCETALQADEQGRPADAAAALQRAREIAPQAPRPLVLSGQRALRDNDAAGAWQAFETMRTHHPATFPLVALDYARAALATGHGEHARAALLAQFTAAPGIDLWQALALLPGEALPPEGLLLRAPSLSAAQALLDSAPPADWSPAALQGLRDALGLAARPLQRYRCAACGFEAQNYFWQCPGCLSWDSFPAQRIEEL